MRRRLATLTVVPLLLLGAAACGEDQPAGPDEPSSEGSVTDSGEGIAGVEINGEVGTVPEVEIDTPLEIDETVSEVVVSGEGDEVVEGEQALLHIYVANGSTGEKAATTYDEGQPAVVTMSEGQLFGSVLDAVVGQPVGSRIAVAAVPEDAYGASGAAQLGLGEDDDVLFVIDVMSVPPTEVLDGPEGEEQEVPDDLPTVIEEDGNVTGLSFENAPKNPADELQVIPLIEGEGEPVRDDSFVTFDYLGQVYGTDNVFDQSYTKEPITFAVGVNQLIKGWDEGLVGIKEGSRVMIIAPPEYGYGAQGNPGANIKGTDTLAFVVDVLGVG